DPFELRERSEATADRGVVRERRARGAASEEVDELGGPGADAAAEHHVAIRVEPANVLGQPAAAALVREIVDRDAQGAHVRGRAGRASGISIGTSTSPAPNRGADAPASSSALSTLWCGIVPSRSRHQRE